MNHADTHPAASVAEFAGRILLAFMFLISGLQKITGYAGTQGYMEAMGVPGALLPLVIAVEVLGAIALIVGYRTRIAAAALAAFTLAAGALFHGSDDPMQRIMLMKNIAITGGFLFLVVHGAGAWSIDARTRRAT